MLGQSHSSLFLLDCLLLVLELSLARILLCAQALALLLKLLLSVKQLLKLGGRDQDRLTKLLGQEETTVVRPHVVLNLAKLTLRLFVLALSDLLLEILPLGLFHLTEALEALPLHLKVLNLLNFKNNRHVQFIEFFEFLKLKIFDLLLSLSEGGFDRGLLLCHVPLVVLQLRDLLLDRGFFLPEVKTLVAKVLDIVDFEGLRVKISNSLVIIFLFFLRLFLNNLIALLILFAGFLLLLLWLLPPNVEFLIEGRQLRVLLRSLGTQTMELALELALFPLDVLDFFLFLLQLASDVCYSADDVALVGLGCLKTVGQILVAGF